MKGINGKIKKKDNSFHKALKISKKLLNYTEQILDEFNSFFANVGPSLTENVPPVSNIYRKCLMSFNGSISDSDLTTKEFKTTFIA